MCMFNLYDDWVNSVSVYTAFSRLILILRSLHVNGEKARMILRPDRSIATQPHHMWPTLSDEQVHPPATNPLTLHVLCCAEFLLRVPATVCVPRQLWEQQGPMRVAGCCGSVYAHRQTPLPFLPAELAGVEWTGHRTAAFLSTPSCMCDSASVWLGDIMWPCTMLLPRQCTCENEPKTL